MVCTLSLAMFLSMMVLRAAMLTASSALGITTTVRLTASSLNVQALWKTGQSVWTLPRLVTEYSIKINSIPLLLMPSIHQSPWLQQPWYWLQLSLPLQSLNGKGCHIDKGLLILSCTGCYVGDNLWWSQKNYQHDNVVVSVMLSTWTRLNISGLVKDRRNSSALAMELRLSCTNPLI